MNNYHEKMLNKDLKKRSKARLKLIALTSASVLFLASCASGSTTPASTSASETLGKREDAVDVLVKNEGEVGVGGILRLAIGRIPSSFNSYTAEGNTVTTGSVLGPTNVSLLKITRAGEFIPNELFLKDFKQTSQSPQIIEYHLVPGNVWSDDTPINYKSAQNVFKIYTDKAYHALGGEEWKKVQSVERGDDDYHVIVKIKPGYFVPEYWGEFIDVLPDAMVATPEIFNSGLKDGPLVVGGPYKFAKLDRVNGSIILVPNEKFKGARKAKFSAISYQVIEEDAAAIAAFKNGQIDVTGAGTSKTYSELKDYANKPGYALRSGPGSSFTTLVPNGTKGRILSDVNLRKALYYAIDRSKIFLALFGTLPYPKGYSQNLLGNSLISQNKAGYEDHAGVFKKDGNIDEAKKSIEKSGWTLGSDGYYKKDGKTLEIRYTYPSTSDSAKIVLPILTDDFKKAGIKLVPRAVSATDFFSKYIDIKDYDLTIFGWAPTLFSLSARSVHTVEGKQNYTGISDPRIDELYNKIANEPNKEERTRLLNEIDKILWEIAAPMPLHQTMDFLVIRDDIANYGINGFASTDWTLRAFVKGSPRLSETYKQ